MINTLLLQNDFGLATDVIELIHQPLPPLADNAIRVEMEMANINPSDLLSIAGVGQYKVHHTPPRVPGFEGVGYVIETNYPSIMIGQKVVVARAGTWQKHIDVYIDDIFNIAEDVPCSYACQLYINSLTAWVILKHTVSVNRNSIVMINAGRSAIGKIFAQLSQSLGFTLIAVTSRPDDYNYGAHYVVDSSQDVMEQFLRDGIPYPNVILDAIGGEAGGSLLHASIDSAQFITYGSLSLEPYAKEFYKLSQQKNINSHFFFLRNWEQSVGKEQRKVEFHIMLNHFIKNDMILDTDSHIPIGEFTKAFELLTDSTKRLQGKVLLTF